MRKSRFLPTTLSLLLALSLIIGLVPALADGSPVIGTIKVINSTTVNVRSGPDTSYPIIDKAQPGAIFECTGTASTGWYEILLDNGQTGYISNKLSSFVASGPTVPTQPQGGLQLTVYYKDVYGTLLNTGYVYLAQGSSTVYPNPLLVPAGYSLIGPQNVVVQVSAQMLAMPSSVTFLYSRQQAAPQQPPAQVPSVTATVPVYYLSQNGGYLATTYETLPYGTNTVYANSNLVGSGYTLISSNAATVQVNAYGQATPATVSFTYAIKVTPAPLVVANIPVYYKDEDGALLNTAYARVTQGSNTVGADNSKVPAGYTITGVTSQQVQVDAAGNAQPASLAFTYRKPLPPVTVNIPVIYRDHLGNQRNQTTASVSSNVQNRVTADNSLAPAGYVLISAKTVNVTVTPQGVASPAQVVFTYQDPATIVTPQMLPEFVKTKPNAGNFPVYTGPGPSYYRVGNATLGAGTIRVYGQEDGWALIGYGTSNGGYRIGFVEMAAIPSNVQPQPLILVHTPKASKDTLFFVDDPIVTTNRELVKRLPVNTEFRLLAYLSNFWAYIEIDNFDNSGKPARGFAPRNDFE